MWHFFLIFIHRVLWKTPGTPRTVFSVMKATILCEEAFKVLATWLRSKWPDISRHLSTKFIHFEDRGNAKWSPEFRDCSIVREHPLGVCFNLNITVSAVRNLTEPYVALDDVCTNRPKELLGDLFGNSDLHVPVSRRKNGVTRRRKLVVELRRSADMFSSPPPSMGKLRERERERAPIRRFR